MRRQILHIGMLHGFSEGLETSHGHYGTLYNQRVKEQRVRLLGIRTYSYRQYFRTQPPILYAGNTQGRSSKETGIKGCELVTSTLGESSIETLETQDIQWGNVRNIIS